jgi:DNA-binding NarL/FixJ family response regulator
MKTLIVEDSLTFRRIFIKALHERFPFLVIEEASRGEDGLEKFENSHPKLVFLDICLPGLSGFELAKRIKATRQKTLVIIVTAHDLPEYKDTAFRSGADAFFPKDSLNMKEIGVLLDCVFSEKSCHPGGPACDRQT